MEYQAFRIEEKKNGVFDRSVKSLNTNDLPNGDLLIKVYYSSLNYKDALSASGNKGVTRNYPHTPGIDAVGVVELAKNSKFYVGQTVLVTGYDLGMNTDGGFGQYIRIPEAWAVELPEGLSMFDAMVLGTAGLTAGLSVHALLNQSVHPDLGPILITGSTGGVGSLAVAIMVKLGFTVSVVTGKQD